MLLGDPHDNAVTDATIGCAIEVHRVLGPGLLESVYESAICVELGLAGRRFERQLSVPLVYKGVRLSDHRVDLIVDERVVVEVKSVSRLEPVHTAQLMTYLRVLNLRVGLVINFNGAVLRQGIKRVML
jgi:GxxExxY protein